MMMNKRLILKALNQYRKEENLTYIESQFVKEIINSLHKFPSEITSNKQFSKFLNSCESTLLPLFGSSYRFLLQELTSILYFYVINSLEEGVIKIEQEKLLCLV